MTARDMLFMAGEFQVTQPLVFLRDVDRWSHTMSSRRLTVNEDGTLSRLGITESLSGFVYYHRAEDVEVERHNLALLAHRRAPCWPEPQMLSRITDRHAVMEMCRHAGLVRHPVLFAKRHSLSWPPLETPFVLKTGQAHQGEGKHLIRTRDDLPESWEGWATIEPFFEGRSARILLIPRLGVGTGRHAFGIWNDNDSSWIKNSAGGETSLWESPPKDLVEHATRVASAFNLEIAGVDYVVDKSGGWHFLEVNQYPGLGGFDPIIDAAKAFLGERMTCLEREVDRVKRR